MVTASPFGTGRLLVVAFEGWNDAGEAASNAVHALKELLKLRPLAEVEPEHYFDYQFNRPTIASDEEGNRQLTWPAVTVYGPEQPGSTPTVGIADDAELSVSGANGSNIYVLLGTEPSRRWKTFTREILETIKTHGITSIVFLGAMLADVPHSRPISVFISSENAGVRAQLSIERSSYEGPVGILSVLGDAAEKAGVTTISVWASVPHYVHNAPSPKATLAILDRLEEILDVVIPRGDLIAEARAWETGIDTLAGDDHDMASYIAQLERARDTVDSPEASGEAIAQEFERYLRRDDDRPGEGLAGEEPWRPKE
ncbi:MAG: PAC2 family protein [Rhodoglobus sp.]